MGINMYYVLEITQTKDNVTPAASIFGYEDSNAAHAAYHQTCASKYSDVESINYSTVRLLDCYGGTILETLINNVPVVSNDDDE